MPKTIDQLSDAELDAMSEDELQAMKEANSTPNKKDDEGAANNDDGQDDVVDTSDNDEKDDDDEKDEEDGKNNADKDDDEDEDEEDGLDADALEALAAEGKAPQNIPYAVLKKSREENADLRAMLRAALGKEPKTEDPAPVAKAPVFDFKAAQREYHKLLLASKEDEALAKLDEIEDARKAQLDWEVSRARDEARDTAVGQVNGSLVQRDVSKVERRLTKDFPFLDANAKGADPIAIAAVNARAKELIKTGKSPAEALREAGNSIGKRWERLLLAEGKGNKKGEGKKPPDGSDNRSRDAIARNLNLQQPPVGGKKGVEKRTEPRIVDITKMTDAQIDKLTPDELVALKMGKQVTR